MTSAIPTHFAHTNFRSRLEARWAALFDLIGWDWVYEPFDADGYIPDFLIPGARPLLVEVGPCITRADYEEKARKPAAAGLTQDVLVVGVAPMPTWSPYRTPVGLLAEHYPAHEGFTTEGNYVEPAGLSAFEEASWHGCRKCRAVAVHSEIFSYAGRPCGHADGDGYLGEVIEQEFDYLWRSAGNEVQWRRG